MRLRLDGYLFRELLPPFFVALLAFLVFIGLELILSLSDVVFARGISAGVLLRLLSYKLPNILTLALPAGVLLATFLALARLASDRELLAFQALGFSLRRLLVPFLVFGFLASAFSFAFSELVVPIAEARYRRELLSLLYRGPAPLVQENVFFRGPEGELFYVERYRSERVEGVVVYDLAGRLYPRSSFPAVVTAKEGILSSGELLLRDGRVLHFGAQGELTEVLGFAELSLHVGEGIEEAVLGGRTPSEMSTRELRQQIELLRKSGHDVLNLLVEYHGKLAVAAASLVFVLFGAPLGALLGHRGRAIGMVVGFLLAAGAQALFLWARTLARRGGLPPALGGWLPHLVFGSLGLLLLLGSDRLKFRGLLLLLLGVAALGAPPFTELTAEQLIVEGKGKLFWADKASLSLEEYIIKALRLSLQEEEEGWLLKAWEAQVVSPKTTVRAEFLQARLSEEGQLRTATLHTFAGEVTFAGPEKEETLRFSAAEGEVEFREGELTRVLGKNVQFTTCPCTEGAPYLVWAEEFLFLPGEWLWARNLQVFSFGYPLVWLPFYAAWLGKESVPFLPELGRGTLGWFLRWSFPWALRDTVGALVLTLYPEVGELDPALWAMWGNGSLYLARERAVFRVEGSFLGERWNVQGGYDASGFLFSLSGGVRGWQLSGQAGLVKTDSSAYMRIPEFTLSRKAAFLGGDLGLRLGFGRYREGGVEGWRAGLEATWSWSTQILGFRLGFPLAFGLHQYPGAERAYLAANPTVYLGRVSLRYQGRIGLGRSLFAFDATPTLSQVGLSFQGGQGDWTQILEFGWDLLGSRLLPVRWSVKAPGAALSFLFQPFVQLQGRWEGTFQGPGWVLKVLGGLSPSAWEDLLLRGVVEGEDWSLGGGIRLGMPLILLKRVAISGEGRLSPEWSWALSGEFDFLTQRFIQLEVSIFRTFFGCLRLGLSGYLGGFRVSLDVPAFPEARIRFAPLDEGLRLGEL
ncbi:MAG: LptF/LptG family permease [Candidatus Bipolaricaulaceae bacterium]